MYQKSKVLKFGGTSVKDAASIKQVIEIIDGQADERRCIVVVSAVSGVTDLLLEGGAQAANGSEQFHHRIKLIEDIHFTIVRDLFPLAQQSGVLSLVKRHINDLESIFESVYRLGELSPRTKDRVASFGEILSSKILSAKLHLIGTENVCKDSRKLIRTDSNFGSAMVDLVTTNELVSTYFASQSEPLFILPGYIGSDAYAITTTLGRGGSDYTASIIAAAIDAESLEIWTDVDGMMTADPRLVRNCRNIPEITYREAMELSHFGAKVIYPPTIQPVMSKGIPLLIKNTFDPSGSGTLVQTTSDTDDGIIRGISTIDRVSILTLEGAGMVGVPGYSKRLFEALSKASINVVLITQSSSEHSISVGVASTAAGIARDVVNKEFEFEIALGKIEPLRGEDDLSILAIVGDGMRHHTGIAGKMFSSLGSQGVNIRAIAQGSSERNISAVIESKDARKAVNAIHEEFFSDGRRQINLFVAGTGNVGKRFLELIREQQAGLAENFSLNVRVIGLANSRSSLIDEDGIDLVRWRDGLLDRSKDGIEGFAQQILDLNLRNSIFVDITASSRVSDAYPELLKNSVSVVACNKIAPSSEYSRYLQLKTLAREFNAAFLFATNVGAGLPVINTLNDLIQSGDQIRRIEAVLSGSLNFIFSNYSGTETFASVVRQAQDEGYTEPDPRLDLSGLDVARKILILAREAGLELEPADVTRRPFLPESCMEGTVDDFYTELERKDETLREYFVDTLSRRLVFKYVATISEGKASTELQALPEEHEFARLQGSDNAVHFYTDRYRDRPLVIKGAGAGADVTAAGVFADVMRAAGRR